MIKFINNSTKKPLSVYIRCIHGSPLNFLDNHSFYEVIKEQANIQVKLDRFDGPLGLLLHLVQREEMSIKELDINKIGDHTHE